MDFAERFRQEKQKSAAPSGGASFAEKFRQETKGSYQKSAETRKAKDVADKKRANLEKSYSETEKYLQDYNDATSGFMGSVLKRFGAGVSSPTLSGSSPVTQSPVYKQAQSYGAENDANLNKSMFLNFREGARKIFTENTADTVYDVFHQEGVDKGYLDLIEKNTKNIIELSRRNKEESNPEFQTRRQVAIDSLIEQNRKIAEEVGGSIKNKTDLQLKGQALGTVLELLPFTVGAGMTKAGKIVLQAGTRQAMKALGKEAALFGASTGASETAKQEGATTGDILKSSAIGAGLGALTVAFPGLTRAGLKWSDKKIAAVIKKMTSKTEKLTPEEEIISKEITSGTTDNKKTSGYADEIKPKPKEIQPEYGIEQGKTISKPESPLLQEARKYKSAEEFVKAQALPESRFEYHLSTDGKLPEGKTFGDLPRSSEAGIRGGSGDEVFSSKNPAIWHSQLGYEGLGKTPDNVYLVEVKNPQTTKMQVEGGIPKSLQTSNLPSDVRIIKNLGKVDGSFDAGLFEFKKEKALTDLYNKAQGGAESNLLQEAGKGLESFRKSVAPRIDASRVGDSNLIQWIKASEKGKGTGATQDAFLEYLQKQKADGAKGLTTTVQTKDGKRFFDGLVKEGYLNEVPANEAFKRGYQYEYTSKIDSYKSQLTDLYNKAQGDGISPKKTSGYSESVKAKALEKEMEDSFKDLAEYTPAVRKEQASMAADLINTDVERVGRILDGSEELPKGLRGSSLAKAVEMYALKTKDATLIQKLVRSKISSGISEAGSELSMLVGRNPRSPLKIARDIVKSRSENLKSRLKGKKVSQAKKESKESIRKELKKDAPTKETWSSFIEDIKC